MMHVVIVMFFIVCLCFVLWSSCDLVGILAVYTVILISLWQWLYNVIDTFGFNAQYWASSWQSCNIFSVECAVWLILCLTGRPILILFTSDNGRGLCSRPHARVRLRLSVRLSVCMITQKCVHWFGWNVTCRQMDEPINFWARSGCTATRNFITSWKKRIGRASQQRWVVLSRMHCNVQFYYVRGKSDVPVLGARRSSDASFWGIETPLSEVNAHYRVHI